MAEEETKKELDPLITQPHGLEQQAKMRGTFATRPDPMITHTSILMVKPQPTTLSLTSLLSPLIA